MARIKFTFFLILATGSINVAISQSTMDKTENYIGPQLGKMQGSEIIIINAPIEIVWEAISNSKALEFWGPPVDSVEIYFQEGVFKEQIGTSRKVYASFGKKSGFFHEHRTEHIEDKKIAYIIDSDEKLGVTQVLKYPGYSQEISKISEGKIKLEWIFYHKPKGLGIFLNWMIKSQQKKNRHEGLIALKKYCESKT